MRGLLRRLVATFLVLACLLYPSTASECRFPKQWKGLWYQSGLGELLIRSSSINLKGFCIEHHREYFLLEDIDHQCYRCLLMMRKHRNIIQYRETYCVPPADLKNVCAQIRVESPLYTIVRIPTNSVPCPFEESYKFRYSGHMTAECSGQTSSMTPCVTNKRVSFHFHNCYDDAFLHDKELEVECLAIWKDGSENNLYARISGSAADVMDNDIYRCFKYEVFGPDLYVSMSADATCMGLESARQGPVTMSMQTDPYGSLQPSCNFPAWFREHDTWRDMSGHTLYSIGDSGKEVFLRHRQRHGEHALTGQLRCIEPAIEREGELHLLSYSTHECTSSFQCVSMWSIGPGLAAFRLGVLASDQDRSVCAAEAGVGVDHAAEILIAQPSPPQPCPLSGFYQRADDITNNNNATCRPLMAAGCNATSTLTLQGTCLPERQQLECVRTLQIGNGTRALLVSDNNERIGCVTYRLEGDVDHIHIGRCDGFSHKMHNLHGIYRRLGGCSVQIPVIPVSEGPDKERSTTPAISDEEAEDKDNGEEDNSREEDVELEDLEVSPSDPELDSESEHGSSDHSNKLHGEGNPPGEYPADSASEPRVLGATPHVVMDTSPRMHEKQYHVLPGDGEDGEDEPAGSKGSVAGNSTRKGQHDQDRRNVNGASCSSPLYPGRPEMLLAWLLMLLLHCRS